ncbi:hypothetical protein [Cellulomonas sp. HZM]|uniref:hypothetical protein n=1 Tax=Cellulomonas sp. HZM TaxID=1454010 RepID=UPI00049305E4|nr:hypothetical protein [Cellulomonas sp. HZM]
MTETHPARLTWSDFAPRVSPGYAAAAGDDDDGEFPIEAAYLWRVEHDGVTYVTDRYLIVREDVAPTGDPMWCQHFMPNPGRAVIEVLLDDAASPAPDGATPSRLSAFHLHLAQRMGWTLKPAAGAPIAIYRGQKFLGAVSASTGEYSVALDADVDRIARVAAALDDGSDALVRYAKAVAVLAALDAPPAIANLTADVAAAVDAVARHVAATSALGGSGGYIGERWEDYPDLGEHDWQRVAGRAKAIAEQMLPDHETYDQAYELLAARATKEA